MLRTNFASAALLVSALSFSYAAISCNTTSDCVAKLRTPGVSTCIDGQCSNPFASGCLRAMAEKDGTNYAGAVNSRVADFVSSGRRRVCNSEDDSGPDDCRRPEFDYNEVRLWNANWESSMFLTWVTQILLSEILDVPTTIETRKDGKDARDSCSFYNTNNGFAYAKAAYNWEAMREAHKLDGDCLKSKEACAHVMLEVWNGEQKSWTEAKEQGYIDQPEGNGAVGKISFCIPAFTANRDWTLTSFYGLRGEENRRKMAETFLRPTNWSDYCTLVSTNNCTVNDGTAKRPPATEEEGASYFVAGNFTGHFRPTDKNDCENNPLTCTGHVVDPPSCTWGTYTESQMYWGDVALSSDGPIEPNSGYGYSQMLQIWSAANATQSNVMMWWWTPDATVQEYVNSAGSFQPVLFPEPTEECQDARFEMDSTARCSSNLTDRLGAEAGSCDYEPHALQKIVSTGLRTATFSVPEAVRSPAYDFINQLRITDLALDTMLREWSLVGIDKYGYDSREVVCKWVYDNMDKLERFIPDGYPRVVQKESLYSTGLIYSAVAVGGLAVLVTLVTAALTYKWRRMQVMVFAQVHFLSWILLGFFFVAIGAIMYAQEPTNATCIVKEWIVTLGYTLELVPLLIKVSALNKVLNASERLRRITINPRRLKLALFSVVALVSVYLAIWTALDPPTKQEDRVLDAGNDHIVNVSMRCSSSSNAWKIVAFFWEGLLLVCAAVLAFQSRNVKQEFNESQSLAFMVYSHFLFMVMRATTYFLQLNGQIAPNVEAGVISFLLSLDTVFTILIYFGPKFLEVVSPRAVRRTGFAGRLRRSSASRNVFSTFNTSSEVPSDVSRFRRKRWRNLLPRDAVHDPTSSAEKSINSRESSSEQELKPEQRPSSRWGDSSISNGVSFVVAGSGISVEEDETMIQNQFATKSNGNIFHPEKHLRRRPTM